jgi:hypothetical protein
VTRSVEIPREDWERLERLLPDVPARRRTAEVLAWGARVLSEDPPPRDGGSAFAREAAEVAVHRCALVLQRERSHSANRGEVRTYEEGIELDRDLVPPLKLEAKELRAEVRALERRSRAAGLDVEAIEPRIDWSQTIAVDGYRPPRYETHDERRAKAVEFFRRTGGA